MIEPTVNIFSDGRVMIASTYDGVMFFTCLYEDGKVEKDFITPSYRKEMTPDRLLQQALHNIVHDEITLTYLKQSRNDL